MPLVAALLLLSLTPPSTPNTYVGDFALFIQTGSEKKYEYLHRDDIGSIVAISKGTIASANDVNWQSNGAWGERRYNQWNGPLDNMLVPTSTAKGFTDHEHLDSVGLIHMNGRVYDPELGRFMSADPFVQAPYNSQSYNRYSYVFNNPLSFTDPSGCQTCSGYNTSDCGIDEIEVPGKRPSTNPCQYSLCGQDAFDYLRNLPNQFDQMSTSFVEWGVDFVGIPTAFNATMETYIQVTNGNYSAVPPILVGAATEFGSKKKKVAENIAEAATDLVANAKVAEKKIEKALDTGKTHEHHSDPKFLGGDTKQKLTQLDEKEHRDLHKDLNNFLRTKTNDNGDHMRPQRGNSGRDIQDNFTRDECVAALCEFYRGVGSKYETAAKDFFDQHPGI